MTHLDESADLKRRFGGLERLYGIDGAAAVTWAIAFHIVSFIPITVIGIVYFARLGLSFGDLGSIGSGGTREDDPRADAAT